jgi:mannonate dehydratase
MAAGARPPYRARRHQRLDDAMRRRDFGRAVATGTAGAALVAPLAGQTRPVRKAAMHVGCQSGGTTIENLEFKARHGVFNIDGDEPKHLEGKGWDLDDSLRKREACEKYGIKLEAYHLWHSQGIERTRFPAIMLGQSPQRDRDIEQVQQMIQVAAKTGVRLLNYNTTILGMLRTGRTVDAKRGNARYNTWNYQEAVKRNEPLTIAGVVTADMMFERITYLLDRILPVAAEYKVQLGNHIADPPTHAGYRGITRWNSPDVFAGIKRFAELYDSPYHGFNLCLGSTAEGLKDPRQEIHPIIRYLGARKQIFNIHLRNIKGGWDSFMEVYPDNGDMDFYQVVRTLRDVGYPYMLCPDHVPDHADPGARNQAFAFAYGYIKAMVQAVNAEAE